MRAVFISIAALVALPMAANAALITGVDRATFQSAVAGGTIAGQNFDGLAAGTILGTLGGVTYSAGGGSPIVTNQFLTSTTPNGLGSTSVGFFVPTETATFGFAAAITAFAIDVNTFATTDGAYAAALSSGDVVTSLFEVFPNTSTGQFIGFVSDTPFTSVTISARTGFSYTLDTLIYGDAAAVSPVQVVEPTTFVLLLTGALVLAYSRKRRHA